MSSSVGCRRHRRGRLEHVQGRPRIAATEIDEVVQRLLAQLDPAAEAALVGQRPLDDGAHLVVGQRLETEHAQS